MFLKCFLLGVVLSALMPLALAEEDLSYLGEWSNGRGETLAITAKTIRFAQNKPLSYRDITRATDGKMFHLQITSAGDANGFGGKFLALSCAGDQMRVVGYRTQADLLHDVDIQSDVTWYKDDAQD